MTHCNPVFGDRRAGTIGLPLPRYRRRDPRPRDGHVPVAPGEQGEMVVRGPQVTQGYWGRPDETAEDVA